MKEECQCPATGRCYHIMVARKKSINLEDDDKNNVKNLRLLNKQGQIEREVVKKHVLVTLIVVSYQHQIQF